jgi:23S rRNA (guanosine2251-2'-O)-methyltransferase
MSEVDLIVGIHSIISALKNPNRSNFQLFGNKEGFSELQKKGFIEKDLVGTLNKEVVSSGHEIQEKAKVVYKEKGFTYSRVPSGIFLLCSPIKIFSPHEINIELESGKPQKIICLDQITDINNAAAILRTAAFYGVDFLVIPQKGNFGFTPSFYRIASGATEFVKIAQCPSLSKFLRKLQEKEILCIGFSEHAEMEIKEVREKISAQKTTCLVLGSEEKGMSHAVEKVLEKKIALIPAGPIKSLNVSVAAAVAMEKIFGDI